MKPALALALLTAAAALPARAGTLYVSYAADERVGTARYRTEIAVENHGSSPARVETRFVSTDGTRHRGLTTAVPAGGSGSLARAVPAGMRGRLEVTALPETVVTARLVAYVRKSRPRSSDEELILAESVMSPPGRTMYFRDLHASDGAVTRVGVVLADDRGSCTLTAHGDMASGMKELGSVRATGVAAVSRDFAEPLRALRVASLAGAWLAVTCDTSALPYVVVLSADDRRASLLTAATAPSVKQGYYEPNWTKKQIEELAVGRHPEPPAPNEEPTKAPPAAPQAVPPGTNEPVQVTGPEEAVTGRPSCIIRVRDLDPDKIPTSRDFFEILRLGAASQPAAPPPG